jgi:hypothetical protein
MKKIVPVLAVILFYSMQAQAAELLKGKIITEKDTINVTFKIPFTIFFKEPNYIKLQEKITYQDASGKACVLKPGYATEIQFSYAGSEIRMLSRFKSIFLGSIFSSNQYIFLKLEVDGDVKLFNHYFRRSSGGMYNGATGMTTGGGSYVANDYILQKGSGDLVLVRDISLETYFSQCPALVEKIKNKTYPIKDMVTIVRYYNSDCKFPSLR